MPVYPELITGREDGAESGEWTVEKGKAQRGGAWCNVRDRVMSVPLEATEGARLVRAHELMHARVSPLPDVMEQSIETATLDSLTVAEELRVNTLVARLGFDMEHLQDGSEAPGAVIIARNNDWAGAVHTLAAVMNTGSEAAVLRALRKGQPAWSKPLTALRTSLRRQLDHPTSLVASTRLDTTGTPAGYANITVPLAAILDRVIGAALPRDDVELRAFKRSLEPGGRRFMSGHFADLVWLPSEDAGAPWETYVRARRHHRPTADGSVMRYPQRLLTDPQRRAFVRRSAIPGGVVVIDQSGSMEPDPDQIYKLVKRFPAALVIGYSHRPGDPGTTPNAWILASDGRVRPSIPAGNVGNGVDGPVLQYALGQRRPGETMVWVSDGQVTDSNDHPVDDLTHEVVRLVRSGPIRMVDKVEDVPRALHPGGWQPLKAPASFGRVGRALSASAEPRRSTIGAAYASLPILSSLGDDSLVPTGLAGLGQWGVGL